MLLQDRILKCTVRPDNKIAIFYKPDQTTQLRAFICTKDELADILKQCKHKTDLTDPSIGTPFAEARILGFFTIEATHPTMHRLLKVLTPFEM